MKSTITAIATPMHQSAIGIIRISGPDAEKILKKIFLFKKKILKLENRKLYFGSIIDENKNHIDEALAFLMSSPNSYTGEDIVEIQTHGSVAVLKITLELIIKAGAVLAEPGEFTKRAFLKGKMDLTEAEAVADIISAKTKESLILSVKQKEGAYSNIIDPIREEILSYLALMEAHIDFCEEDIPEIDMKYFSERLNFWEKNIKNILKKIKEKNVYSEGITAVITGKTNVGKSSLLNTLLNEDRAIVTDIAGTTRDTLDAYINIKGIHLKIIDTAGIRSNPDSIEQIGISKTFKSIEKADIILFIADNSSNLTNEDIEIL